MIKLRTMRIMPLLADEVEDYAEAKLGSVETDADIDWCREHIIRPMIADPDHWEFYTIWLATTLQGEIVVETGFKGPPNEYGEVEIGYYTIKEFRNLEYATEVVEAMVDWVKDQPRVRFVCAAVKEDNKASQRVLEKNGFHYSGDNKGHMVWQKFLK